jgi:hypothetical protein
MRALTIPLRESQTILSDDCALTQQDRCVQQTISAEGDRPNASAGSYRVVTDEELIDGISFPAYRRVATMIFVPASPGTSSVEMVTIDPLDLQAALDRDASA